MKLFILTLCIPFVACHTNSIAGVNVDTGIFLVTHSDGATDTLTINGSPYLHNNTFYTVRGTDTVAIDSAVVNFKPFNQ